MCLMMGGRVVYDDVDSGALSSSESDDNMTTPEAQQQQQQTPFDADDDHADGSYE